MRTGYRKWRAWATDRASAAVIAAGWWVWSVYEAATGTVYMRVYGPGGEKACVRIGHHCGPRTRELFQIVQGRHPVGYLADLTGWLERLAGEVRCASH